MESHNNRPTQQTKKCGPVKRKESTSLSNRKKKKILLIGDSHMRGCASELRKYLGPNYEVSGTIMPGARTQNVINLGRNEISGLSHNETYHLLKQDLSSININGVVIQNTQTIANTFNSYYSSEAEHLTKEINTSNTVCGNQNPVTYLQYLLHQSFLSCEFKHVSPKEIENVAKSLKAKDSHGYDEIPTKVIIQGISYTYIFILGPHL